MSAAFGFDDGLRLHQQGRLAEAEEIYRAVLQRQPDHFAALHLLGVVALQTRRAALAVELITRAIALDGSVAPAHCNLGHALLALQRRSEALGCYDRAIALQSSFAEAHNNRGIALLELDRAEDAVASYDAAIALRQNFAEAHNNRGLALHALCRYEQAIASYDRAIALKPDYAEAYSNGGLALQELKGSEAALLTYDKAIALKPDYAQAHYNRGIALQDLNRREEALASYGRAIALDPDYAEANYNRGLVLQSLDRPVEAIARYDWAIGRQPGFAKAHANRATALQELDCHEAALASYERAIALHPGVAQVHVNYGMCLLKLGDLPRGWAEYEWRWRTPKKLQTARDFGRPLWLGTETLAGKTILLHAEQGFGDALQFCRYASLVAARGARVVLEVHIPLVRLLHSLGAGKVVAAGDPLPPFDLHCPLMSLPLAFGTSLETIPARDRYIAAEPTAVAAWRQRLAALPGRRVGLVWAGLMLGDSPEILARNRRRATTLQQLAPLATVPGVSFVSLQKADATAEARASAPAMELFDPTGELVDFADTAALVETLDLVISVDTAVAHLAGALGKPVWILNRFDACWRWLLDREDSPWYPTARLFRQPAPGDWFAVIAQVRAALLEWTAQ